jgi:type II secretory pathway pseudopilin PulG
MVKARCPLRPAQIAVRCDGYAMVALLVALSVMSIMLTVALPAWNTAARREKEAELVFRGEQYARALALFSRRVANAAPPNLDVLVEQKFLRKKYKDPITGDDFEILTPGSVIEGSATPPGQRPGTQSSGRAGSGVATGTATGTGTNTGRGTSSGSGTGTGTATGTGGARGSLLSQTLQSSQTSGRGSATGVATSTLVGQTFGANAGVTGVRSKSKEKSLRVYNGAERYNEWLFVARQSGGAGAGAAGGAAGPQNQPPQGGRGERGRGSATPPTSPFGRGAGSGRSGSPVTVPPVVNRGF